MKFFSSEYNSLHMEPEQLKRVKSAFNLKMDSVDFETQTGKIKNYDVSLDKCTCMDFGRRRKPCKHIYRLALELGVFNVNTGTTKTVSNSIVPVKEFDNINMINCSYVFSYEKLAPKSFVVIDFETANTCPDSICQMGIVTVENNLIVDRQNFLIRPPYEEFSFTNIHGITLNDVKNELTFGELWSRIKNYIEGHTIVAYNLSFDLNCLLATLSRYEIPYLNFNAFDVLANVRDELLKNRSKINYDEYKELFKLIEQIAANRDNTLLYKYCGMFYEKSNRISRAISLYERALSLNERIGLKGKIQKLRRELQN